MPPREAASGFFAEVWPGGWSDGASVLAAGDGEGALEGAGATGGREESGDSTFAAMGGGLGAIGGFGVDAAGVGSMDAGTGLAFSVDGGAESFGGSGRGVSAFAAVGGGLGGSGAAATMAGAFTNAASGGETSVGGAPESAAGVFRVG